MPFADEIGASGGIRVRRETMVMVEDGGRLMDARNMSPTTTIQSGCAGTQLEQYGRPKAFRKLSNASSLLQDIFRPETSEETIRRKIKRANDRDTSGDLIDFLRNTTPPPSNYMSKPDVFDFGSKRFKKRTFWPWFWRRAKKRKKPVGLIKLPDSAVAGRTIGGYRHIAISIPLEYAHTETPMHRPMLPAVEPYRALTAENHGRATPGTNPAPVGNAAAQLTRGRRGTKPTESSTLYKMLQ